MHEHSLMADLLRTIERIGREQNARKILGVRIRLGALSHISPDHLSEHFVQAAAGTMAEGARLDIVEIPDMSDPNAQEIILESVEIEE
jgi:hydrogenase nickel incorporation protein HypA/HybF